MGTVRLALILGGLGGAALMGACGLVEGGIGGDVDSGMMPDVVMGDGGSMDTFVLPDAPMDMMTPDLGTGETEAGVLCTCTPALPQGWSFVAYDQKNKPTCSMGYDTATNTFENLNAPAPTCGCSEPMAPATNPTCDGNTQFNIGFDKNGSCNTVTDNPTCNANCSAYNKNLNGGGGDFTYFSAQGTPTPTGGSCQAPTPNVVKQAAQYDSGRFCKLKGAPGACGMGACVTTPSQAGDVVCIFKAGVQSCNGTGFPNAHFVGDMFSDTRNCGPDPCNGTKVTLSKGTCSTPSLQLYSDNQCSTAIFGMAQAADNICRQVNIGGNSISVQSCKQSGSTNSGASCSYTGNFGPTGTASLGAISTICCL